MGLVPVGGLSVNGSILAPAEFFDEYSDEDRCSFVEPGSIRIVRRLSDSMTANTFGSLALKAV